MAQIIALIYAISFVLIICFYIYYWYCEIYKKKIQQTPDLKKLEAKFEALFNEETEESFNKWLVDKQPNIKQNNITQQTAVDWFIDKLDELIPFVNEKTAIAFNKLVEQAKCMEKQRHKHTWYDSRVNTHITFEQYYNETYNKTIKKD